MPATWCVPAEDRPPARVHSGPTPASPAHSQRRSHIHKLTALSAVCLAAGFLACIMLWAFDPGPDLWPSGAESFSIESSGLWETSDPPGCVSTALISIRRHVTAASAHLVLRHRARSALAVDSPLISSLAFSLAEPWDPTEMDPGLGHIVLRRVKW